MNNFKHKVLLVCRDDAHASELITKIEALGYKQGFCLSRPYPSSLITLLLLSGGTGSYQNTWSLHTHMCDSLNPIIASSEEEFLAIAAIKEDDIYHVGEHLVITAPVKDLVDGTSLNVGNIIRVESIRSSNWNGRYENWLYYEVLLGPQGKGEYSRFSDTSDMCRKLTRKLTIEEINAFYKQKINKSMKHFSVTGSLILREAFIKQLEVEGLRVCSTLKKDINRWVYLIPSTAENVEIAGILHIGTARTNYMLPQDWNVALEACKALKPQDFQFALPHQGGALTVTVTKDKISHPEIAAQTPAMLRKIIDQFQVGYIMDDLGLNVNSINIGCKQGIPLSSLEELLKKYDETFKD